MLFTSAGDNTNFDNIWIGDNMNYDIYVIYYNDNNEIFEKYKSKVKFIEKRKGSKFQNFLYFYNKYPEIISQYEYFFILDDDIIFDINDINTMFEVANKYNLSICGPTYLNNKDKGTNGPGKDIYKPNTLLTYTNFIEVGIPLFNKNALDNLMKVLHPSLIGWGIDILYIWANGINEKKKFASIHIVNCINPSPEQKPLNRGREHKYIKGDNRERWLWKKYARNIGCPVKLKGIEYENIKLD